MEEKILLDKIETPIDRDGTAHVMGTLNGETFEIGTIHGTSRLNGEQLHQYVESVIEQNGFALKPMFTPAPAPKRKYTKHVHLGLASEYGKVALKVVNNEPKVITCYHLYIKGTDKFVYKLDDKGIYVTNGKKTKPMAFTSADIKVIKNLDDFDVVKVTKETKYIKNKIAPKA